MSDAVIRTVLADVVPSTFGSLDYHEHLFQDSPLLPSDRLTEESASEREGRSLHVAGIDAMIEATPTGLGANPEGVARISAATGLQVVHTTGAHHAGHYLDDAAIRHFSESQLADLFIADVTEGFRVGSGRPAVGPDGDPIRAGIAKAGIRYWSIGSFEHGVIDAVAATHIATGVPVMVHLDYGSASHEVLDLLAARNVPPEKVVLAHIDRNLDPGLHGSLIERGAYLGYDGMARHREAPDSAIIDCLATVVNSFGPGRVLLGGDVARASRYRAYGGLPGLDYLPTRFIPRLRAAVGDAAVDSMLVGNGRAFLQFSPPPRSRDALGGGNFANDPKEQAI